LVVAASELHHDAIQDIAGEESGEELLDFEYEVAGGVVGEITLNESKFTLKKRKRMNLTPKTMV
jgi:hypothetical protein